MGETEAWTLGAHCVWGGWLPSPLREEKETGVASLWTPWSSSRTTCYPEKRGRTPEALRCEDAGAVLMCCGSNSPEWKDTASSPHAVEDHLTWRRTTTHGGRPLHTQEEPLPSGRTPSRAGGPPPLSRRTQPAHCTRSPHAVEDHLLEGKDTARLTPH